MFGNFSLFKTPFPGQDSLPGMELPPYLRCLFFCLLYFSYLFFKTMILFSGYLMSSAGIQKLFCDIYSALKCSFDEFLEEKVVSLSYSSNIFVSNSLQPNVLYSLWNSPRQNTGVGSLSLLQGIFQTQESNRGLLHCRQILYQLSYEGSPNDGRTGNEDRGQP